MTRRDLRRRQPILVEFEERYEPDTDIFAVIGYVGSGTGRVSTTGGYVRNWSSLTPDQQATVRADLRATAEREAYAGKGST